MAIPPPPGPPMPPGPPPPPMSGLKLGGTAGGDPRSALLQSIQKGTKLRKTTTVDKSGPALAGKVCDANSANSGSLKRSNHPQARINNDSSAVGNGAPKLGGLFEGLTSMPKLKPVNGSRVISTSQRSTDTNNTLNKVDTNVGSTTTAAQSCKSQVDFSTELSKHLTLKQQKQLVSATETNLKTNRGPPPQPPATKNLVTSSSDSILEKPKANSNGIRSNPLLIENTKASSPTILERREQSTPVGVGGAVGNVKSKAANLNISLGNSTVHNKNSQNTTVSSQHSSKTMPIKIVSKLNASTCGKSETHSTENISSSSQSTQNAFSIRNVSPNKSTLFGTSTVANGCENDEISRNVLMNPSDPNKSPTPSNKTVLNHGKPNFAPKPPGLQRLNLVHNGQRPLVARHHSMKSPRSPPNSGGGGPAFPTQQHFGTMRTPLQLCQSQDAINTNIRTAPNPPIGRPTVAPPKPPSAKPPPPPTPSRSVSNSNLYSPPQNTSPTSSVTQSIASNAAQLGPVGQSTHSSTSTRSNMNSASSTNAFSSGSPVQKSHSNREKAPMPIILNGGSVIAPPLPPHRTCPAPPPPQRQSSNIGSGPPVPPQRHSSIRANAPLTPPNSMGSMNFGSGNLTHANSVGRLVIDLESKFGKRFHNVTEFPKPPPFLNIEKVYPSRNLRTTNVPKSTPGGSIQNERPIQPGFQPIKKHRAPAPPPQAGVAAATVSVIRQSSYLYGGAQI